MRTDAIADRWHVVLAAARAAAADDYDYPPASERSWRCSRIEATRFLTIAGGLWVSMPARADVTAATTASVAPLEFRHDDGDLALHAGIATAFVLIVAIVAALIVKYGRRGGVLPPRGAAEATSVRVLSVRRVTPRLSIVTVQIEAAKTVVFADNGQSLLLLASKESPAAPHGNGESR